MPNQGETIVDYLTLKVLLLRRSRVRLRRAKQSRSHHHVERLEAHRLRLR